MRASDLISSGTAVAPVARRRPFVGATMGVKSLRFDEEECIAEIEVKGAPSKNRADGM